jgi:hypothetical protein
MIISYTAGCSLVAREEIDIKNLIYLFSQLSVTSFLIARFHVLDLGESYMEGVVRRLS